MEWSELISAGVALIYFRGRDVGVGVVVDPVFVDGGGSLTLIMTRRIRRIFGSWRCRFSLHAKRRLGEMGQSHG